MAPLLDPMLRQAAAFVYIADLESPEPTVEDTHHLLASLRLRPGEIVATADGAGGYRCCRLAAGAGASGQGRRAGRPAAGALLEPVTPIRRVERAMPAVTLGLSLAKNDRTEWAVAKLVEIGVDRIVPLVCDRTVVRPGGGRLERMERIAREAAMQARRLYLPEVRGPIPFAVAAEELRHGAGGLALAEPGGEPVCLQQPVVLVGPEGGWSDTERALRLPQVGLGETVLRIETAAIVAGAMLVALRNGLVLPVQARSS